MISYYPLNFRDFYERDALMMSEEGIIVGGLLVGLNVIDCNLCVKEEDLDYQVIFFFTFCTFYQLQYFLNIYNGIISRNIYRSI